jgi:hypothetical protein
MSYEAFSEFEAAIKRTLGEEMKANDAACVELWSALANVDWYHPEKNYAVSYSFRVAGGMIADMIERGTYMDWYCSGPYPEVSDRIARTLKKEGWISDVLGPICDEPGCIASVSCGTPVPGGTYRSTCSKHAPRFDRSPG